MRFKNIYVCLTRKDVPISTRKLLNFKPLIMKTFTANGSFEAGQFYLPF